MTAEAEGGNPKPNPNAPLSNAQANKFTGGQSAIDAAEQKLEDFYQHTAFSRKPHLFHPTHGRISSGGLDRLWRSRDHRKGRHHHPQGLTLGQKIGRLFKPELTNLAWWIAFAFTIGSVAWCINGFFIFLPFVHESLVPNVNAIGWTEWLGATIFFFAAWPEVWEALFREDTPNYTWDTAPASPGTTDGGASSQGSAKVISKGDVDKEKGYGTEQHIKGRSVNRGNRFLGMNLSRFRELGFVGAFIQAWAATIFWIGGFTGLPQVQNSIKNNTPLLNGVFWTPQVIGGCGFMISAAIFMLEAQHRWWKPNVTDIGWQVGFWNFVGGAGFTLCAVFGYSTQHWRLYQSALSTFWGSWAFLIGSGVQWWESVNPR